MLKWIKTFKAYFLATGYSGALLLVHPVLIVLVTRRRSLDAAAEVDSSSIIQIGFMAICILFLVREYIFKTNKFLKRILYHSPIKYMLIFIGLSFLSALWSVSPPLTIYRSFECLVFLLLIIFTLKNLITRYSYQQVIKWTIFFAFWNLLIGIIYRFRAVGFTTFSIPFNPSRLFFPLFFFIIILLSNKLYNKAITFLVVILGFSNKIFIGIALGFISFLKGGFRQKLIIIIAGLALIFLVFSLGLDSILLNTVFYGRDSVGLEDSSGRNYFWNFLIEKGLEQPYLGYGFAAGEVNILTQYRSGAVINAHNSLISAFVNVGVIGVLLLIMFFYSVFVFAIRMKFQDQKSKVAFLGTIIIVMIVSMSAPGIGSRVYGSWIPAMYLISLVIGLGTFYKLVPEK